MNRRKFLLNASLAAGSAGLMGFNNASASVNKSAANGFQLLYAPHFGMFKNSAGDDLVDQLNFIYERGFRALEDNSMKKRSLADQERVAKTMSKLDMTMGVFVAHTIDWKETTLASGDEEKRATFLREIKESSKSPLLINQLTLG